MKNIPNPVAWNRIVPTSFDPAAGTYIFNFGHHFGLLNTDGKVLARFTVPPPEHEPRTIDENIAAMWGLLVRDDEVPGGKAPWTALAFSASHQTWLIQDKQSGVVKVLRLPKSVTTEAKRSIH